MAHIYLQEDPKVSVADANDAASSIPTPEQLGSLLLTYAATGSTGQTAAMYAALAIGGTAQWVPVGATGGGSSPVLPANEIAFGTGAGIDSSPQLTFVESTGILDLIAPNAEPMLEARATSAGAKYFRVYDPSFNSIFNVNATTGGRQVSIEDENGFVVLSVDTKSAGRLIESVDATNTVTVFRVDTKDGTGAQFVDIASANAFAGWGIGAGPYWIQSVLKPTETPGNGTGMLCNYSDGPGGVGWYTTAGILATE